MNPNRNTQFERVRNFLGTTSQGQSYSVAITTAILVFVVLFGGVLPAIGATISQITENQRLGEQLGKIKNKQLVLQKLATDEKSKQATITEFTRGMPETLNEGDLILIINNFALDSQVNVMNLSFTRIENRRKLGSVFGTTDKLQGKYLSINAEGTKANIEAFIQALEQSTRIFNIRNLTIQKKDNRSAPAQGVQPALTLSLRAETYYWDPSIIVQ